MIRACKWSQATWMKVERLLVDLVALLDVNDSPEEPASDPLRAVQDHVAPGLPAWASAGAMDHRDIVTTTLEQYVLLVEINAPAANGQGPVVTEAIGDTGAT